jgi:hypothetical protein
MLSSKKQKNMATIQYNRIIDILGLVFMCAHSVVLVLRYTTYGTLQTHIWWQQKQNQDLMVLELIHYEEKSELHRYCIDQQPQCNPERKR